ncbi:hypothetical protein K505DRAFT_122678 [Melanomma pulvis-pyrius CBS 109.77]|uniref:Uncharacterized protein n=1 Tax=Melanomma pulvis-pyrius CBS 109.77 TaxID=1314802 RepID=A0A6A6XNW5_9PLEO|nr:hypothetical protein K505DRAFT_122678 [Melanomma pulvis-pyrius CBS 109.77]
MLHTLQMPMKQKVMLEGGFSLGSCVSIKFIVRIIYVYHLIGDGSEEKREVLEELSGSWTEGSSMKWGSVWLILNRLREQIIK